MWNSHANTALFNGTIANMAHPKISRHYHPDIAYYLFATGLVVIKGAVCI